MLGIVFNEFVEMVEETFSADMVERMIAATEDRLRSRAAYTAFAQYDHEEMLLLVAELSRLTSIDMPDLVRRYGQHLFGRFVVRYPAFFHGISDTFTFLERVETHIHYEVRTLYPEAELPTFTCTRTGPRSMDMVYKSSRPFAMLALGLVEGCGHHFGDRLRIAFEELSGGAMTHARFALRRQPSTALADVRVAAHA